MISETFLGNEGHAIHVSPLDDEGCFSVLGISHESESYTLSWGYENRTANRPALTTNHLPIECWWKMMSFIVIV